VEDDIHTGTGTLDGLRVPDVGLNSADPGFFVVRVSAAAQDNHIIAPRVQHVRDSTAQEPASTRNKGFHRSRLAAQVASASRLILTL
jgi:hypothetical protein